MDSFIGNNLTPARTTAGLILMLAALSTLSLTGCAVGPDYVPPRMDLPQTYKSQAALNSAEQGSQAPALDSWWTGFRDPQLERIIKRVLEQNLDLAGSMARIQQARAAAMGAGSLRMPQGTMDASGAWEYQSIESPLGKIGHAFPGYERSQTLESVSIGASWELDLAGGLKRNAEAARDEAQAAEAMWAGVRISVAAEAADAYFRVLGANARIEVIEWEVETDTRLLDLEQKRMIYGVATKRDLARVEARLAQDRASLPPLRTELELQLNRLDVLMGAVPGTYASELKAARSDYVIPTIATGEGPKELLRRRPDVIAAERRLAAATARIGVATAEYYPKVSLAGLLGFESLSARAMFSSATFQPAAVAGLRWRLFDFGRVDAEVTQAKGGRAEALVAYRKAMLRATEDVENTMTAFVQLYVQKEDVTRGLKALELAYTAAQEEQSAGTGDLVDVLSEERQLLAARDALAHVKAEEARASVAVFRALGGGWAPATVNGEANH